MLLFKQLRFESATLIKQQMYVQKGAPSQVNNKAMFYWDQPFLVGLVG